MADSSDCENSLVNAIASVLYPTGTSGSPLVAPARVYRGWPSNETLDADLQAGTLNVTVYPRRGMMRNTTRYQQQDAVITSAPTPTFTVSVSGATVTFGGTAGAGQVVGIQVGRTIYAYRCVAGDTPATVAAFLGGLVSGATIAGPAVTLPTNTTVIARVAADVSSITEVRRQEMHFMVSFWSGTPAQRDAAASAVDAALANTPWIALADGTSGRLIWAGGDTTDRSENSNAYRRDLFYSIEFPTTLAALLPLMLFGGITMPGQWYVVQGTYALATGTDGALLLGTDGDTLVLTADGANPQ